ncbi:MAG: helix-turn-helix domain-containing protein [Candidatus Omnitrophota bacterium]|nr:helix-turn-helix domain-containing protein [Candidatus Omnitrophota bacterium]
MATNNFRDNFEEKIVEFIKKETLYPESQIRTELTQAKQATSLGHVLKYGRQKKRINVKKMAELLKVDEAIIKELESGETRKFPLGLITAYCNALNCILTFKIEEQLRK